MWKTNVNIILLLLKYLLRPNRKKIKTCILPWSLVDEMKRIKDEEAEASRLEKFRLAEQKKKELEDWKAQAFSKIETQEDRKKKVLIDLQNNFTSWMA